MAATPKTKGGVDKAQRRLSFAKDGAFGLETEGRKTSYSPPEHFKKIDGTETLVEEALDSNIELWLIRVPVNEITQEDLVEKKLRITVDSADGKMGHFFSLQGQEYNIVRQDNGDVIQPYAVLPTGSGPYNVRKIRRQVCFVRNQRLTKDPNLLEASFQPAQEVLNPQKIDPVATHSERSREKSSKKKRRRDAAAES